MAESWQVQAARDVERRVTSYILCRDLTSFILETTKTLWPITRHLWFYLA